MVTLLQAWFGVSDEDAVDFAEMDKRWLMLLGVLDRDEAPFSQGSLFNFRQRQAVEQRRQRGMRVYCKPFPLRNHGRFTKADFRLNFETRTITCPANVSVQFVPGGIARLPAASCLERPTRQQCTTAASRSISIHPQQAFLVELRARQRTPEGRAILRERIPVEHCLAHTGATQGKRARHIGTREEPL
jgi:hypothetical protein